MATRIYVGNLPYSADDQQLSQLFEAFGEVVESSVVIDRSTNQSKGFGFVQMANDEEARNAIAGLNGTMLGNRTIRVNEAQPRPERSGGGSRGGYGGGDRYSSDRGGYDRGYSGDRSGSGSGYGDRRRRDDGGRGYGRQDRDY